jgi:hypothetical protein
MVYTDPILEEKYWVQKMLAEEAKDLHDYFVRAEHEVSEYFAKHGWKLNHRPCEVRRTYKD